MKCRSPKIQTIARTHIRSRNTFPRFVKPIPGFPGRHSNRKKGYLFFSFDFCGKRRSFFDSGFREGNNTCSFSRILEAECPGKKSFTNLAVCASVYLGNRNKQNLTVQFPSFSGKQLCASWHVRRWRRSGHQKFSSASITKLLSGILKMWERLLFFWRGLSRNYSEGTVKPRKKSL